MREDFEAHHTQRFIDALCFATLVQPGADDWEHRLQGRVDDQANLCDSARRKPLAAITPMISWT